MTHLIRQQHLHVKYHGSETEALALQQRLPGLYYDHLLPAIEGTLDRYSTGERHHYLERLEIDAGLLAVEHLERDLAVSVARALERSLQEELSKAGGPPRERSPEQTLLDAFLYFLETGTLLWSFRLPPGSDLERAVLSCLQESGAAGRLSEALQRGVTGLLDSGLVRRRLVLQFSVGFLEDLLSLLSPRAAETVGDVSRKLGGLSVPDAALRQIKEKVWEGAFAGVAKGGVPSEQELVAEVWRALPPSSQKHPGVAAELERFWPGVTGKVAIPPLQGDEMPRVADTAPAPVVRLPDSAQGTEAVGEHPGAREGIYVDNAGLVLLHPFLPQLFRGLGIAREDELLQPERALCLLHFLSTGKVTAPEYQVMLPKVLCGIGLPAPVTLDAGLTAAEQEECTELLESVIRHWGALGNSSPDGLRGTFLLRPGKLSLREDDEWLLQVESSGCDILLDQIPWGLSMIKLPWMPKLLWVEWN